MIKGIHWQQAVGCYPNQSVTLLFLTDDFCWSRFENCTTSCANAHQERTLPMCMDPRTHAFNKLVGDPPIDKRFGGKQNLSVASPYLTLIHWSAELKRNLLYPFLCVSTIQRTTTTRPRRLCLWAWRLTEERMWPCLLKAPWPTCCTGSKSRTTSPMWWHTQPVSARTGNTVPLTAGLPVRAPSSPASQLFSQSSEFCADLPACLTLLKPNQSQLLRFHSFVAFYVLIFHSYDHRASVSPHLCCLNSDMHKEYFYYLRQI